jgi:hypothetical protein
MREKYLRIFKISRTWLLMDAAGLLLTCALLFMQRVPADSTCSSLMEDFLSSLKLTLQVRKAAELLPPEFIC